MGSCCSDVAGGQSAIGTTAAGQLNSANDAVDLFLRSRGYNGLFSQIELSFSASELRDRDILSKDVSNELEEQKDEFLSQLKEDDLSRSNLMQFADHCTLSDKQYVPEMMQKSSEPQLADLQTKKHVRNFTEEREQLKIFAELVSVSQLSPTDKEALVKCWKVFETLQKETELMTETIKELRKENELLKNKSETFDLDLTFVHLLNERKSLEEELEKTKKQKATLESLCRSLHAERKKSSSQEKKE